MLSLEETETSRIQTETPLVSIVTPSFNQAQFIEKTIRSVLLQNYVNLEYIVLDAMSTDGTDKIMSRYKAHAQMIREPDEGQADAIDKGFKLCRGDILAYINSDDCFTNPHVVSRVVQIFQENPNIDVIIGKREYIDEKGFYVQNYPFRTFDGKLLLESCYVPQEATFWRTSLYKKAGNFIDKTLKFAMDYDLWLRFHKAGGTFLSVDEYFGLFRWYPGQKSIDIWKKHGVPEIARLQEKYSGHAVPEDEMIAIYQKYWYGADRLKDLDAFKYAMKTWRTFTAYKQKLLSNVTRDAWVFQSYLKIPKRRHD